MKENRKERQTRQAIGDHLITRSQLVKRQWNTNSGMLNFLSHTLRRILRSHSIGAIY